MKVLVIGSRIPFPLYDGGAIATYNMLKGLSDNGVEVTYYSLNTKKHFLEDHLIQNKFSFLSCIRYFEIDTRIRALDAFKNLFTRSSYNIERFYSLEFEDLLLSMLEMEDYPYDIIHFEGLFVAKYVEAIKAHSTLPVILRQHNVEYKIWERLAENEWNPLKKWYLRLLAKRMEAFEKDIIHHFDKVVTIADTDEDLMKEWKGLKSVTTIPGGFEIPEVTTMNNGAMIPQSVYHIGSMEWLPNRQAMEWFHRSVWPKVLKVLPDAQFFMAGKNMPAKYNTWESANFHVLGEVANAAGFAADKQLLVVPLLSASGIRIKTIEAMLMGKAVITTSLGAKGLPVVNHTHCMIADTAEDFAQAIVHLLQNPEKTQLIQENGRQLMINNYEMHAVAKKWTALYRSMLPG